MRATDTDFCDAHFKRDGSYVPADDVFTVSTNGSKADVALCGDCLDAAIRPLAKKPSLIPAASRNRGRARASAKVGPAKKRTGRYAKKTCPICGERSGNMYMHFKGTHPELDYQAYAKAKASA